MITGHERDLHILLKIYLVNRIYAAEKSVT